ncbi:MAG: hypothetical protein JHC74_02400, partial [Thermoleophilia bacterium]|nr:hypothetical protein [Thermoleophilia bacterium]
MGPEQGPGRPGLTDAAGQTARRLRRALIGVSMALAVALLLVGGILLYWRFYLLGPEGD